MGFIIVGIILFMIIAIVLSTVLGNLRNRATQTILKDTPFSNSAINKTTENVLGKRATKKFLEEHGNIYTEESIKDYFVEAGRHLINKESMSEFSEKVVEKMNNDSKLNKLQQAQITRVSIMSYARNILTVFVVANDGRDEYMITMYSSVNANGVASIDKYTIQKGVAVGF